MPELSIQTILQLVSLGVIVLWTTRLARNKGLNPWVWGVASVLLIALAWNFSPNFLAPVVIAPLIFLLLFRSPLFRRGKRAESMTCPSCGATETGGLNFCVQCGWDLSRISSDSPQQGQTTLSSAGVAETAVAEEAASDSSSAPGKGLAEAETTGHDGVATAEKFQPPAQESVPEAASEPAPDSVAESVPEASPDVAPEPVLAQETMSEPVSAQASAQAAEHAPGQAPEQVPHIAADAEPAPAPTSPPAGAPRAPRPIPTPANMTERGIYLFNQGRFQEAIDQFTKAIALDPDYKEALERRAEAYGRLGRPERQKADQRRLEAF